MKITIIEKQHFHQEKLVESKERVIYPENIHQLQHCITGHMAEKIRLEIEFKKGDIPALIQFLDHSIECFPI